MTGPLPTLSARRRRSCEAVLLGLAMASVLAAAGCSSSKPAAPTTTTEPLSGFAAQTPAAILAAGCAATLPVASVAVASSFSNPSLVGGLRSMTWVMSTAADKGILHYKPNATVNVVVVPNVTYIKAPASWWSTTSAAASASSLANKWISISSASTSAVIATPLIAYGNLQVTLASCTAPGMTLTKGPLGSVGKTQTIDVTVAGGSISQHLSIPTQTIPYVAKSILRSALAGQETSLLTGFNSQKPVTAPTGAVPIESPGAPAS